jgi:hypothetical protein
MSVENQRVNLVELVKDQLSGGVLTKLAETLGTSQDSTRTPVNAAVPTLLAALGNLSSTRDGAQTLASAVDSVDDRVLANIPQSLASSGRSAFDLVCVC